MSLIFVRVTYGSTPMYISLILSLIKSVAFPRLRPDKKIFPTSGKFIEPSLLIVKE